MVRAKLIAINDTEDEKQLNFRDMGNLTQPIRGSSVSVVKFSIPNAGNPFLEFIDDRYKITLTYGGFEFTQAVEWEDRGTSLNGIKRVFEVDHLCSMINTAFIDAVTGLNALSALPSTEAPRIVYNVDTSRYEMIALASLYGSIIVSPVKIYCNRPLFYILQSLPIISHQSNAPEKKYEFLFKQIFENTYLTNYIKIVQESITISNYCNVRNILITTQMPVEGMIISSTSESSGQSSLNVIQSYTIPYNNGIVDECENLDFEQPQDNYRSCALASNVDIYSIRCDVYYETSTGEIRPFYLPPFTSANIELEFL
jgi:hypothetical protein